MDPVLPFACPRCGIRSVAVGICPECRLVLVAQAMTPGPEPPAPSQPAGEEPPPVAVHGGLSDECEEVARILQRRGIPVSLVQSDGASGGRGRMLLFEVLVPAPWSDQARQALAEAWEQEAERQGLDPVTEGEALALEAQGICPACGDPLLPGAPACASCGIALA